MNEPCCTAAKSNGEPCAARPLPGSEFCLFHDPAHQHVLAQGRREGGGVRRCRRTHRYPPVLDYKHVAELLSEILVEALNDPAACDPQRLRALTGLSQVLLKAVGRPKDSHVAYKDRTEPAASDEHLLRIYTPDPPELARILAAEAELEAELAAQDPDPSDPPHPSAPSPAPEPITPNSQPPTPDTVPDDAAVSAESERYFRTPPEDIAAWRAAYYASPDSVVREPDWSRPNPEPEQTWQQEGEQDPNRSATGTPATDLFSPTPAVPSPCEHDPQLDTSAEYEASSAATDPSTQTPSPPASVSRAGGAEGALWGPRPGAPAGDLRGENSSPTTLSVPGIPILISIRRIPGPFG